MNNAIVDFLVKSIMLGDSGVGKTTLSKKMTNNLINYSETSTVGIDFYAINTCINKNKVKLQIWDTAGNERFHHLVKFYFKNNAICYVVFDVCSEITFNNISMWINEYKKNSPNKKSIIVLVANKIDCLNKRIITSSLGKELADAHNALYIEVSSKASVGIEQLIMEPLERVFKLYNDKIILSSDTSGIRNIKDEHKQLEPITVMCCSVQ